MSRIDEAFKRASGQVVLDLPAAEPVNASASSQSSGDRSILDRYVVEPSQSPARPVPAAPVMPAVAKLTEERFAAPQAASGRLVVTPEMSGVSIEQYRRLAAKLHEMQEERGVKSLMVSSAVPGEGKTLTVSNLALTLSDAFKRQVLLIDADFRRPSVHELFGLSNTAGLAEALQSSNTQLRPVRVSSNLSVMPAGRVEGSPTAALSSGSLQAIVADATTCFDWVLVDTPPIALLHDAHVVARATDGVLFVIAAGMTPYDVVQKSLMEIGKDRILGTVLNRVDERSLPVHGYYSQDYPNRQ